jgi:hypothetical protein
MIHNHWLSIAHHDAQSLAQYNTPCVNHGVLCWASYWIMVSYADQVFVNHGVFCWASGYESWCVILSQWVWIMVRYADLVDVNHCELCWASCCESCWDIPTYWLTITHHESYTRSSAYLTMFHSHWHSITHHNSQTLANHISTWFTTTGST